MVDRPRARVDRRQQFDLLTGQQPGLVVRVVRRPIVQHPRHRALEFREPREQLAHIPLVLALDLGSETYSLLADAPLDEPRRRLHGSREQILEDMALAQNLKKKGHRIWLTYTRDLTGTRMYDSFSDVWTGLGRLSFPMLC